MLKQKRDDCVVRSLVSATGVSYRTAHKYCKETLGRVDKKGTPNVTMFAAFKKAEKAGMQIGNKNFSISKLGTYDIKNLYRLKGQDIFRKKTLKSFIESHPKGTYLVLVAKHSLTVKDGELLDWKNNRFEPTRKVMGAYKLEEINNQLSLF